MTGNIGKDVSPQLDTKNSYKHMLVCEARVTNQNFIHCSHI